ncbi:MAG: uracil-DNA glycosylase [Clostridiales bacterium]|nr:uracil-DNA glycosylase [Clostridiales bacterium]
MADWETLRRDCERCRQCALGETRTNLVFGDGSTSAKLMLVGEGPGQQEDLTGVPFVGPAGQLLDQMMAIIDLDRTKYYITNIVKCHPPRNRDPLATEQEACIGYLREQTRLLQPRVIVCLGRIASMRLIRPDYRITREHGQWVQRGGVWMTAIYRPSALLRDESKRPETFDDLMSIRDKLAELFPEGV